MATTTEILDRPTPPAPPAPPPVSAPLGGGFGTGTMRVRRAAAAALTSLALLGLAACGGDQEATSSSRPRTQVSAEVPTGASPSGTSSPSGTGGTGGTGGAGESDGATATPKPGQPGSDVLDVQVAAARRAAERSLKAMYVFDATRDKPDYFVTRLKGLATGHYIQTLRAAFGPGDATPEWRDLVRTQTRGRLGALSLQAAPEGPVTLQQVAFVASFAVERSTAASRAWSTTSNQRQRITMTRSAGRWLVDDVQPADGADAPIPEESALPSPDGGAR